MSTIVPYIEAFASVTVTIILSLTLNSSDVAVIVAEPVATAVITPVSETVATSSLSLI